jgi:hypothetical protein
VEIDPETGSTCRSDERARDGTKLKSIDPRFVIVRFLSAHGLLVGFYKFPIVELWIKEIMNFLP